MEALRLFAALCCVIMSDAATDSIIYNLHGDKSREGSIRASMTWGRNQQQGYHWSGRFSTAMPSSGRIGTVDPSSSEDKDNTRWLINAPLRYITTAGRYVDINLPRISNTESCTFITPKGKTVKVEENHIPGVMSLGSSEYVSCRIVVGPMDESLLGLWTLCGLNPEKITHLEYRRCQRVNIVWRDAKNPDAKWPTTVNPVFNHVVNFYGTLTPAVYGSGIVCSCHIITPNNEDLIVTRDSHYPNIKLVQDTDSTCIIAIGPIKEAHLGEWTIYGTFDSALKGFNEVRFPMTLDLADKNHPYDQPYNVTKLIPIDHLVNLGSKVVVEVTNPGVVDVCIFTMPSGISYNTLDHKVFPVGIYFLQYKRVACRISIGPITENMLGTWELIGNFNDRDTHAKKILRFRIIQENPKRPIQEDRRVEYLHDQEFDTYIGATHTITIPQQSGNTPQSCHIKTPEDLQYTIMEGFDIPEVKPETAPGVACGIVVKVSENLIGNWTLISRETRSGELIERRQPFRIYVEENVEALPKGISVNAGSSIEVRLAKPTDLHSTCNLVAPDGQESPFTSIDGRYVDTCGFIVSSVGAQQSGTWNIVYGTRIIYKAPVVVKIIERLSTPTTEGWRPNTTPTPRLVNLPPTTTADWRPNTTSTPRLDGWWSRFIKPADGNGNTTIDSSQHETIKVELPVSYLLDRDVHFALSLVPLLRARPQSAKVNTEIDILRYFKHRVGHDGKTLDGRSKNSGN